MIGDEAIRRISILAAIGFILTVAIGVWLFAGTPGLPTAAPLVVPTMTQLVVGPTEAADAQRLIIVVVTPTASEPRSVDDFGFPPGYQLPAGAQAGVVEEIPDLKRITPQVPSVGQPGQVLPSGEQLVESARKAVEQGKEVVQQITGPTPTPTPRPGIFGTGIGAGIPGWIWVGVFILFAIVALITTGFGIERV